mgnify:CR=1 FL=1
MKKTFIYALVFAVMLSLTGLASAAEQCNLNVSLLNQDPYPAIPGEYVKLVLSVDGLNNAECGDVYVELVNNFPISFDNGVKNTVILNSGAYVSDYQNYALIPFKVRVDENALNDEYELDVKFASNYKKGGNPSFITKKISLAVEDANTVFEISVKDYDYTKKTLTFEIINVGDQDVSALTVDLDDSDNFVSKGTTRAIVGGLDSNDDTSFSFIGIPKSGDIPLKISYNDPQNVRRYAAEKTSFDESLFIDKSLATTGPNYGIYVVVIIIALIIFFVVRSSIRKRRKLEQMKSRKA